MTTYLSPPQVAEQLGIDRKKVVAWINSGELAAVNCSEKKNSRRPRWRVTQDAVDAFLAGRMNHRPAVQVKPHRIKPRKEYV